MIPGPAFPHPSNLIDALSSLKPQDHLCLIYGSPEEWRSVVVPFISMGLARKEKCVYIVDDHTAEEIENYLEEEGMDVKAA